MASGITVPVFNTLHRAFNELNDEWIQLFHMNLQVYSGSDEAKTKELLSEFAEYRRQSSIPVNMAGFTEFTLPTRQAGIDLIAERVKQFGLALGVPTDDHGNMYVLGFNPGEFKNHRELICVALDGRAKIQRAYISHINNSDLTKPSPQPFDDATSWRPGKAVFKTKTEAPSAEMRGIVCLEVLLPLADGSYETQEFRLKKQFSIGLCHNVYVNADSRSSFISQIGNIMYKNGIHFLGGDFNSNHPHSSGSTRRSRGPLQYVTPNVTTTRNHNYDGWVSSVTLLTKFHGSVHTELGVSDHRGVGLIFNAKNVVLDDHTDVDGDYNPNTNKDIRML